MLDSYEFKVGQSRSLSQKKRSIDEEFDTEEETATIITKMAKRLSY